MKHQFELLYIHDKDFMVPDVISRTLFEGRPNGTELTDIEVHLLEVQHTL